MFTFNPGTIVVLEGLDGTGKSTQLDALRRSDSGETATSYLHMPSGFGEVTPRIYEILESSHRLNPLARQLLHLASHAENRDAIQGALLKGSVVLDRFWWSMVAYGLSDPNFGFSPGDKAAVQSLIDSIWADTTPDIVFLFTVIHDPDHRNKPEIVKTYELMAARHPERTVKVPDGDSDRVTEFVIAELADRQLIQRGSN
ncbi:MAG: uncharacterized protein JWO18_2289 [Microbacteriaceae bacterium]|nr:uncharacterized protein [Microbacteriaceae bacterium]